MKENSLPTSKTRKINWVRFGSLKILGLKSVSNRCQIPSKYTGEYNKSILKLFDIIYEHYQSTVSRS